MNPPKTIRTQSDDSRAQKHAVLPLNPKRHSSSFRRVLVLVYGTVVLFALPMSGTRYVEESSPRSVLSI